MRIILLFVIVVAAGASGARKTVKKQLENNVETVLERPPVLVVQEFKGFDVAEQLPQRVKGIVGSMSLPRINNGNVDPISENVGTAAPVAGPIAGPEAAPAAAPVAGPVADKAEDEPTDDNNDTTVNSEEDEEYLDDCFPHICNRMYLPLCTMVNGKQVTAPSPCEFNNRVICARMARSVGKRAPAIRFLHRGPCLSDY